MPCYRCGHPDGTEVTLCMRCREDRLRDTISIQQSVNRKGEGLAPYIRIVMEEWHIAIGSIVMIGIAVRAIMWFVFAPSVPFDPSGLLGPNGADLFQACMNVLQHETLDEADKQSIIDAYKKEIEEYISKPAQPDEERLTDSLEIALHVRADQACTAARIACETGPETSACSSFIKMYLKGEKLS